MSICSARQGWVTTIVLDRPERRNAVDPAHADALRGAFEAFDEDPQARVAVLWGAGGTFCAGADLDTVATDPEAFGLDAGGPGPMGPTRMRLAKPVIAAVAGHAVAGGLELALWCDLRVVEEDAIFGVYCRRHGVPLVDGGSVRLPRLIGMSHALDMVLTGRAVAAEEARQIGLANRVVGRGEARAAAERLAAELAEFPQACLRGDRASVYEQWGFDLQGALRNEHGHGRHTLDSGESRAGARRFVAGSRDDGSRT